MPLLNTHCNYKPKFTGWAWNFTGQDPSEL